MFSVILSVLQLSMKIIGKFQIPELAPDHHNSDDEGTSSLKVSRDDHMVALRLEGQEMTQEISDEFSKFYCLLLRDFVVNGSPASPSLPSLSSPLSKFAPPQQPQLQPQVCPFNTP